LHTEPFEQDDRIAIGTIIAVSVWVKEEIWDIQHEHTTVSERESRGEVETIDKVLDLVHPTVLIGIGENRQTIRASRTVWRWRWDTIVASARIAIDADSLKSFRIGILKVLDHPQSAAIVPIDRNRLPDERFACDQVNAQSWSDLHFGESFFECKPLGMNTIANEEGQGDAT
jgi:hypothetical protein